MKMKSLFHSPYALAIGTLTLALSCLVCARPAQANVYATNIKLNGSLSSVNVSAGTTVNISYILNEAASLGATIKILSGSIVVRTITVAGGNPGASRGANSVAWDGKNDLG